ncbi:uncharacterized protein DS421_8g240720 [Arachis hypogaea]|nr:uncharacterized protein DS421_8g240720 [Arachis hypogaea]
MIQLILNHIHLTVREQRRVNPSRPNPNLPPRPPSSLRSPVISATAVAWSSAQVTLFLRLVPCPVALHLRRLHLLNTSRQ